MGAQVGRPEGSKNKIGRPGKQMDLVEQGKLYIKDSQHFISQISFIDSDDHSIAMAQYYGTMACAKFLQALVEKTGS